MSNKQLAALFVCSFIPYAIGSGLLGLLAVYATRLGADPAQTGLFLAFAFLALAISTVITGRFADRFQRRKELLIACGALAVPLTGLMAGATSVAQLTILTAVLWFVAGIILVMVNILAGLFAEEGERGRIFGIIGLSIPLGGVLGGLASGPIVDRWGFPTLFTLSALLYMVVPITGLLLKDKVVARPQRDALTPAPRGFFTHRTFLFLFFASILANLANSQLILARPLIMDGLHFDATAISSTGAVGGLIALPLPLLVGWLSDRLGRKPFLILCYLTTAVGLVVLAAAFDLWHFWVAGALQATLTASLVVGSALITDMFPQESLGASLSLFNATPWIGFVIGFGGSGAAIEAFEMTPTLMIGVLLTLVAILLLMPIRERDTQHQAVAT